MSCFAVLGSVHIAQLGCFKLFLLPNEECLVEWASISLSSSWYSPIKANLSAEISDPEVPFINLNFLSSVITPLNNFDWNIFLAFIALVVGESFGSCETFGVRTGELLRSPSHIMSTSGRECSECKAVPLWLPTVYPSSSETCCWSECCI